MRQVHFRPIQVKCKFPAEIISHVGKCSFKATIYREQRAYNALPAWRMQNNVFFSDFHLGAEPLLCRCLCFIYNFCPFAFISHCPMLTFPDSRMNDRWKMIKTHAKMFSFLVFASIRNDESRVYYRYNLYRYSYEYVRWDRTEHIPTV